MVSGVPFARVLVRSRGLPVTNICTSSTLSLLARLNDMEKKMADAEHKPDTLDFIMRFESGDIVDEQEIYDGFQQLIDSGLVWQLQGTYGRTAAMLIDAGYCHRANEGE